MASKFRQTSDKPCQDQLSRQASSKHQASVSKQKLVRHELGNSQARISKCRQAQAKVGQGSARGSKSWQAPGKIGKDQQIADKHHASIRQVMLTSRQSSDKSGKS